MQTDITILLDRSGSMSSIKEDMEGGLNTFLTEQKAVKGEANLTLVQFDDTYEVVYESKDIKDVPNITLNPRGMTAYYDALGKTIVTTGERLEKNPSDNVLFIIITDGHENASREYSAEKLKEMIQHQKEKYSWEFIYLGANQDSLVESSKIGIVHSEDWKSTPVGIRGMSASLSCKTSNYRKTGSIT